jgi:hypothetical protein
MIVLNHKGGKQMKKICGYAIAAKRRAVRNRGMKDIEAARENDRLIKARQEDYSRESKVYGMHVHEYNRKKNLL